MKHWGGDIALTAMDERVRKMFGYQKQKGTGRHVGQSRLSVH